MTKNSRALVTGKGVTVSLLGTVMIVLLIALWFGIVNRSPYWFVGLLMAFGVLGLLVLVTRKPKEQTTHYPRHTTLNRLLCDMNTQYAHNKERFGYALKVAVFLSGLGIIAAGIALILDARTAGASLVVIGFLEPMGLWALWAFNEWRNPE
jgi:hypothetical protein